VNNHDNNIWRSTALEINLERTKTIVEIPDKYMTLIDVAQKHYGVLKRTEELLIELNHPFVNWEYVLNQLKGLSIGDFHDFNIHEDGFSALKILSDVYFMIISSASDEDIQDSAIRYFFEYLNTLLSNSNNNLARNTAIFPFVFQSFFTVSLSENSLLKKSSSYIKSTIKLILEHHIDVDISDLNKLLYNAFDSTYLLAHRARSLRMVFFQWRNARSR
jgi:pyruvate,orthophosphate dikinase